MTNIDWNSIGGFERYEKLNNHLQSVGDKMDVVFKDDGKLVGKDLLRDALKAKGLKNINAKDSYVFTVENAKVMYELWLSATSYSNLRELKIIRDRNNGTLTGAKVKVERVSKNDTEKASMKFSLLS